MKIHLKYHLGYLDFLLGYRSVIHKSQISTQARLIWMQ